jgi:protein-disulfide isomerase
MTRSRAAERREEREAETRRQRRRNTIIAIAAVALLAIIIIVLVTLPAEAPLPENTLTRYTAVSQSRTEEGYARLGDPDASVTVRAYSSFACPVCRTLHDEAMSGLIDRVNSGDMQFIFVPLTLGAVTNGRGAARAAICATEQNKFWELHDALFHWQGLFGNQAFSNNRIVTGLTAVGLDRGQYDSCLGSGRADTVLTAAEQEASALLNFNGTPTISINGVVPVNDENIPIQGAQEILARIDEVIASGAAESEPEPVATEEATPSPTEAPTVEATTAPTEQPTQRPTAAPTIEPTTAPTNTPSS